MTNLSNTLEDFLQGSRVLIGNSQNLPEVAAKLAAYGYTSARFLEGMNLLKQAEALVAQQRKEYGDQFEATEAAMAAWAEADRAYMKTLKVARLVFDDDVQAITSLKLAGTRKASMAGWMDQAVVFYGNLTAQSRLASAMGRFGYTPAKLAAEKALVDEVVSRVQSQAKETGEAQQATAARDAALKALDAWVGDLRAILKLALDNDPAALEAVGISDRAPGSKKKAAVTG